MKDFVIGTKNHFRSEIKIIRSDNGTEYDNKNVNNFLKARGIKLLTSAPYTPEQNGRAEREMRTIVESARTMLLVRDLPKNLWAEAVNMAVYALNRILGARSDTATPFELWMNKKPDLSHTRQFGYDAYSLIPGALRKKWDNKSEKLILVGYEHESDNYRLFDSKTGRIIVSRHVRFNEDLPRSEVEDGVRLRVIDDSKKELAKQQNDANDNQNNAHDIDDPRDDNQAGDPEPEVENEVDVLPPHAGEIAAPNAPPEPEPYNLRPRDSLRLPNKYNACIAFDDEPSSFKDALSRDDSIFWQRAIDTELSAHAKNQTWEIVKQPIDRRAVGFKWVFKIKNQSTTDEKLYKARLCAQGCSQEQGVDYDEIFSAVVRFESVHVLLAIAAQERLETLQFDVGTAYLNSDLHETVYMRIPDGLNVDNKKNVLKLNKALYGLK